MNLQVEEVTALVLDRGFRVVLVQPRTVLRQQGATAGKIQQLEQLPVALQVNAGALLLWRTRRLGLELLREAPIPLLASDCHNLTTRIPQFTGGAAGGPSETGQRLPGPSGCQRAAAGGARGPLKRPAGPAGCILPPVCYTKSTRDKSLRLSGRQGGRKDELDEYSKPCAAGLRPDAPAQGGEEIDVARPARWWTPSWRRDLLILIRPMSTPAARTPSAKPGGAPPPGQLHPATKLNARGSRHPRIRPGRSWKRAWNAPAPATLTTTCSTHCRTPMCITTTTGTCGTL